MASASRIRAGKAFVQLYADDNLFVRGLKLAEAKLKNWGMRVSQIGRKMAVAGAAMAAPLALSAKTFAQFGDSVDKASKRLGVSTEFISELGFAAEQSGSDMATLETGIKSMQRSIYDAERGLATANDAFADLGVNAKTLQGLSPEQQFEAIADAVSRVSDPTKRAALAMQVFGRSGQKLIPLLSEGVEGIRALRGEAKIIGRSLSAEQAAAAAKLTDSYNRLRRTLQGVQIVIGGALAPALTATIEKTVSASLVVAGFVKANQKAILVAGGTATALLAAGAAAIVAGAALSGLGAIVGTVATAAGLLLSPLALVAAAAVAGGVAIVKMSSQVGAAVTWLGERFKQLAGYVRQTIGGIGDALTAGDIKLAAEILWTELKIVYERGKNAVLGVVSDLWYGILAAGNQAFYGLKVAWIETVAALKSVWAEFSNFVQQGIGSIQTAAGNLALKLGDAVGGKVGAALTGVGLANTGAGAARQQVSEQDRGAALAAAEAARAKAREDAKTLRDAMEAEIGQRSLDDDSRRNEQLKRLKRERDEALQTAREKKAGTAPGAGAAADIKRFLDQFTDALDGVDSLASRTRTFGTFNAAALRGLGGSSEERTAKATEETARNTATLVRRADNGGITFA